MTTSTTMHRLYRRYRETGEMDDWLIQTSDTPPLVIFADKAGARKYRRTIIDGDQLSDGIPVIRERMSAEKESQGYAYLGDAEVSDDGRLINTPKRDPAKSLFWSTNGKPFDRDRVRKALSDIGGVLRGKQWFGVNVEWDPVLESLRLSRDEAGAVHSSNIGLDGPDPMFRSNGRAAGTISPNYMPIATLVMMSLKRSVETIAFSDDTGNNVQPAFDNQNVWLLPHIYPLSVQRPIAARLGLCLEPIDFGACQSIGLGF